MRTQKLITDLIIKHQRGENIKYLFFWGHRKSKDGSITKSCFSQWWEDYPFTVEGITYNSTEHWMMAKKALLFNDEEIFQQIIMSKSPAEAKKLGRKVRNFNEKLWIDNRFDIVVNGNYHKFSQHEELKIFLLNTNNRVLVEASPVDNIWGIGLAADNEKCNHPEQWRGLNLLGFALMEVRAKLKNE